MPIASDDKRTQFVVARHNNVGCPEVDQGGLETGGLDPQMPNSTERFLAGRLHSIAVGTHAVQEVGRRRDDHPRAKNSAGCGRTAQRSNFDRNTLTCLFF